MATDVFLSVGRTYTDEQARFVTALEAQLYAVALTPHTVGRNEFSSSAPLKTIAEVLDSCHGTVVLAFERTNADVVIDRPGSSSETTSLGVRLPTVWNQIEASMSYAKRLPLLVIIEHGLKDEGLLESRYDWHVQWVDLKEQSLGCMEFQGVLSDWRKRVEAHAKSPGDIAADLAPGDLTLKQISPGDLTLKQIRGALTLRQAWGGAVAIVTVLGAVATLAYWLGGLGGGA